MMKLERFGDIAKNLDNKRVPLNSMERSAKSKKGLYPYIGANNIVGYIDEYIFDEKILCIAEDGGNWGLGQECAKIYEGKTWVNNHAHVIVENGKAKLEYIKGYLNATNLNKYITGTTRGKLTKSVLENIKIPLPPLTDQIRIAEILSQAESLIAQRKQSISLLDELLKSTFLEMFGDPVRNEKKWKQDKVGNQCDCIVPGRDKPKSFTGNTPWIKTEDLNHLGFFSNANKNTGLTHEEITEVKAKVIPTGSVIITCVGELGVASINKIPCVINQQLHAFMCNENLNNSFLMYNLSFQSKFMYNNASTTTVPYMNKTICNSIPILIPPINLQTKFSAIVEKVEALTSQYQQSSTELQNMYGVLSQKAFKGELNIKDVLVK